MFNLAFELQGFNKRWTTDLHMLLRCLARRNGTKNNQHRINSSETGESWPKTDR